VPATVVPHSSPTLRRALGRWDLTAIGVNQVIGGAIFLTGSQVAAEIGGWSAVGFLLMGLASLTIAVRWRDLAPAFAVALSRE